MPCLRIWFKKSLASLIVIFTFLSLPIHLYAQTPAMKATKQVLLINAYHKGYLWTDEITRGVEDILGSAGAELHIEYMDTKRQYNDAYLELLAALLEQKNKKHHYDVVIVSDNNAFNFISGKGRQIFKDVPVVFCGFNYLRPSHLIGLTNFTGVNEQGDIKGNVELIRSLHPDLKKIVVITDNTSTGQRVQDETIRISKGKDQGVDQIELIYDIDMADLKTYLTHLENGTIVLLSFFFQG